MMQLKIIFALMLLLLPTISLANDFDSGRSKPDFATMKQEMIARLNTELACVQAAKDESALRACRPKPMGGPGNANKPPPPPAD